MDPTGEQAKFNNIINEPLFIGPDSKLVLDCFPPPTLHLLLRTMNHILDKLTEAGKTYFLDENGNGLDIVLQFAKENWIVKKSYHGGNYEGNMCLAILKKLERLVAKLPEDLKPFTNCLYNLKNVMSSCFGSEVSPDYIVHIDNFKESFKVLGISITPTLHSVFHHVKHWYARHGTSHGLAYFGEQATETAHTDWMKVWLKGYKVADSHPNYGDKLLSCVAKYNRDRR